MRTLGWILVFIGFCLLAGILFLYIRQKTATISPLPDENVKVIEVGN